jgi:hypothetical protein
VCEDDSQIHEDLDLAAHLLEADMKIGFENDMIAGMSARRMDDSPRKFYDYVMRYERTLKQHEIRGIAPRLPVFVYLSLYFPVKMLRLFYDPQKRTLSINKMRKHLSSASSARDIAEK